MGGGSSKVAPPSNNNSKTQYENESLRRKTNLQEQQIRRLDEQVAKLGGTTSRRSEDVEKRLRKKRLAVSAEASKKNAEEPLLKPVVIPKDPSSAKLLLEAVQESILFHVDANPTAAQAFVDAFSGPESVSNGTEIISQGQESADATKLYVLAEGTCRILVDGTEVGTYAAGQSFGELALMYNQPRKATIEASSDCQLWSLERKVFSQTAQYYKTQQNQKLMDVLSRVPSLKMLSEMDRHVLAESLEEAHYSQGDYVVRQGHPGDHFYIIEHGSIVAEKDGEGVVATMGPGDFFGERALLSEDSRAASCRVESDEAVVLTLDREHFEMMVGSLDDYVAKETKAIEARNATTTADAPEGAKGIKELFAINVDNTWSLLDFNENISNWNVSNVINMEGMFCNSIAFNQPIDKWNVSNVRTMYTMFQRAKSFKQTLPDEWKNKAGYTFEEQKHENGGLDDGDGSSWDI